MIRFPLPLATGLVALAAAPALAVDETFDTEGPAIHVATVADGLERPWGLVFLPDGSMLVTEKPGTLRHVSAAGALSGLAGFMLLARSPVPTSRA